MMKYGIATIAILFLFQQSAIAEKPEKTVEKSYNVASDGTLTVDTDLGSIDVRTHSEKTVEIRVVFKSKTSSEKKFQVALEEFELNFAQKGNDVLVTGDWENDNWFKNNPFNVEFHVVVPKSYHVDLQTSGGSIQVADLDGDVIAATSGGSLRFGNIDGTVKGRTSGGSVSVESCNGDIDVKTSGGSITLGRVSGNMVAHTSGGSINVNEVEGNVDAKTSGGSVHATLLKNPTDACSFKTSGGGIEVRLPEDAKCTIDASTSGGSVSTDFPILVQGKWGSNSLKGDINGGGPLVECRTSGGGIRILKN